MCLKVLWFLQGPGRAWWFCLNFGKALDGTRPWPRGAHGLADVGEGGGQKEKKREEDEERLKWAGPGPACFQTEIPGALPGSSKAIWGSPG